jgi:hypothetical protein
MNNNRKLNPPIARGMVSEFIEQADCHGGFQRLTSGKRRHIMVFDIERSSRMDEVDLKILMSFCKAQPPDPGATP